MLKRETVASIEEDQLLPWYANVTVMIVPGPTDTQRVRELPEHIRTIASAPLISNSNAFRKSLDRHQYGTKA